MIYTDGPIEGVFVEEDGKLTTIKEVWHDGELIWQNRLPLIIHEVELSGVWGSNVMFPLVNITVPPGETWMVRVHGEILKEADNRASPVLYIGDWESGDIFPRGSIGGWVDETHPLTSGGVVAMTSPESYASRSASFVGTVTIDPNPV